MRRFSPLNIASILATFLLFCPAVKAQNCTTYYPNPATFPFFSTLQGAQYVTVAQVNGIAQPPVMVPIPASGPGAILWDNPRNFADGVFGANGDGLFQSCSGVFPSAGPSSINPANPAFAITETVSSSNGTLNINVQGTIIVLNLNGSCPDTCLLDQGGFTQTYVYNIRSGGYSIQATASEHTIFTDNNGNTIDSTTTLNGSASGVWPLVPPLQITTSTLKPAQVGVAYSVTLTASGGIAPYSWTITSGALPSGFSLTSSSGVISGTALSNNPFPTELMIEVTDAIGDTASKALFLGVTPAARQLLSDADKEVCREHAMTDAGYGITFGILEGEAAADPLTEPLVPFFEFLREEFALDALYWTGLSLDAPDSNFKVIALPAFAVLPKSTNHGSHSAETEALLILAAILDQEIGYENAMLTAINRAQGAFAANNQFWAAQQLHAASLYAFALSELLRIEPGAAANLQAVLDANNFPAIQITQQMLSQIEQNVSENGLPQDVVQGLEGLGADATAISAIQRLLSFPNANSGSFPALLTATAFEQSMSAAANAALDFAKTYAVFPF